MTLLDRYIFRTAATACFATLLALTAVIWITQSLREIDLLTGQGQTILVFLAVTGLTVPALVTIIAPVSLFIAVVYALNKLNGDSELIVMSASGLPPRRLLRPFAALTTIIALVVALMTLWAMPASFRMLRDLVTKIRADFVTKIVREGQFNTLDTGITFHYRERSGEALLGIFMQDRREKDQSTVYIAERGQTVDANGSVYLVLEQGSVQRETAGARDPAIISFERYAIDLSQLSGPDEVAAYKPRERPTSELLALDRDHYYVKLREGYFRSELHERFSAPLYPFAFLMIAFAALGTARTTRQGRGLAVGSAVLAVAALRIAGFGVQSLIVRSPNAVALAYVLPAAASLGAGFIAFRPVVTDLLGRRRARAFRANPAPA